VGIMRFVLKCSFVWIFHVAVSWIQLLVAWFYRGGSGSVHMGLVMEKVTVGQAFFAQYFSFPMSVSFHHCSILIHPSTTHTV
jgi:hypothetical protein